MRTGLCAASVAIVSATLGACGGGGGGGGVANPSAIEVPLTSFAVVAPNQTVVMEGTSATMTGTATQSGGATVITSAERSPIDTASVKFSYDSARALSAINVSTPQASFSFDRNAGHTVSCSGSGTCRAENPTVDALVVDPTVAGWNYQSFGVWGTELSATTWQLGAISAGSPTSGAALPTTGTATFTGIASGIYVDLAGTPYATIAGMSAAVDFGSRSIQFSTSDTRLSNSNTDARTTDNGLNLSGTLSYAQGVNSFSGAVGTQNLQLSGQGAGRFYGPAAEEIGGVYSLQGNGVSRMLGGFGGKR